MAPGRALRAGYLDALEYADRLDRTPAARTRAELAALTADLPAAVHRDPDRARRADAAAHAAVRSVVRSALTAPVG